ncbi:MAG: STAS domain-containing protein [Spirochaetales bacterium]|nr:STAS domain-containing protein [Spirochaetales bacterium]
MEFKKSVDGTKITYSVSGRLDTNTAPMLNADLTESLEGMTELVLDLKDLEYISSAGVRVLLSAYKVMSKRGGMVLKNLPDMVREVLSVTGLLDFFTIQ